MRAAKIEKAKSNALFYPVNRWGGVELNRLSDKAVDRIVKSACRPAGLKDKGYSAHSLAREAYKPRRSRAAPTGRRSSATGHSNDAMLDRYAREADLFTNNSSGTLDYDR
jgi:hypothetical protein